MRNFFLWIFSFIFIFFVPAGAVHAATSSIETLMTQDIGSLLNTPVTISSRTPQRLESVSAAVTVITAEDIERGGYTHVWDLLRKVPGVNVAQLSANTVGVSIRGFNDKYSNMVQVLQDGRSLFNPITQGVWWVDQPIFIEDIDRIEVMRGPGAVMYGYNAFNGVINIKTKPPSMTKGFQAVTTVGLGKDQQYYARVGDSAGNLDYRLSMQADSSQGLGDNDGKAYIDGRRLNAYNLRTDYSLAEGRDIEFLAGAKQGTRGLQPDLANTDGSLYTDYQMFRYNHRLDPDAGFTVQMSRTLWDLDIFKVNPSGHDVVYRQYDLEAQYDFKPLENHTIVWGGNYRWNEGRDNYLVDPYRYYHDVISRGFLQDTMNVT
ncbi:MAG: TonB-dependent receptor, partial [Candidatus Omnitrophota bacterium]